MEVTSKMKNIEPVVCTSGRPHPRYLSFIIVIMPWCRFDMTLKLARYVTIP